MIFATPTPSADDPNKNFPRVNTNPIFSFSHVLLFLVDGMWLIQDKG